MMKPGPSRALPMCDYVFGPRSTFSWWAAYYMEGPNIAKSVVPMRR